MAGITKRHHDSINKLRERKERTRESVFRALTEIVRDNPDVFKKQPEGRTKTLPSILRKAKGIHECTIENIEDHVDDIAGVRVTCCTVDEIPHVVELIQNHPAVIRVKSTRSWETIDKDGYRAEHLQVKSKVSFENKTIVDTCEVQIRSLAMDLWAVLSRRDFYEAAVKPPVNVLSDMVTLGKLMAVVDDLALSLKRRAREETESQLRQTDKGRPTKAHDVLSFENVSRLARKHFGINVSIDDYGNFIAYALRHGVRSFLVYKKAFTDKDTRKYIDGIFAEAGVAPRVIDRLCAPILLVTTERNEARHRLQRVASKLGADLGIKEVEKGKLGGPSDIAHEPADGARETPK
jgi:putative GTP pyrophosphokinase